GSHSDVGGSYPETESRLSDIALAWMVEEAERLPHPIRVDRSVLKLYPDAAGGQHNERKAAIAACPRSLARLALQFVDRAISSGARGTGAFHEMPSCTPLSSSALRCPAYSCTTRSGPIVRRRCATTGPSLAIGRPANARL